MRRRQKDIWNQPWVMIAVVVGIVAVIGIALLVFFGGSAGSLVTPGSAAPVTAKLTVTSGTSSVPAAVKTTPAVTGTSVVTIQETTPVSVPLEGVYVKVSYIGGYSGTYGVGGTMEKVLGSGDRVYAVNTTGGTLQAAFQKRDSSASHDLVVEIWKGGKALASQKNSSAYGLVSVSSSV
ncbi:hypothetical protein [uncultured Methanoregula sp.]|uniref:hypothetical protein n=1 Tax=uncultured Methanoregula sp. TaxID=1005933 RepID=UPI002AAADED7|nr:hypothetical protein [uncultured Methanoregula sp.]